MQRPAENMILSSEEGESLIAQVHRSNLPVAVASRLEQIIRLCLWLVFALQESKITVTRLRRVLFGKAFEASTPTPADSSTASPGADDATSASVILQADAADADATAGEAPPQASQRPPQVKPRGGHRAGTGRLGADAYVGAERVECRHEDLAGRTCRGGKVSWLGTLHSSARALRPSCRQHLKYPEHAPVAKFLEN